MVPVLPSYYIGLVKLQKTEKNPNKPTQNNPPKNPNQKKKPVSEDSATIFEINVFMKNIQGPQ